MQSLLYISFVLFLITEIVLNRMFRSTLTDKKNADQRSLKILWLTIALSLIIAGIIADNFVWRIYKSINLYYISLTILYLGMLIRIFAVYSLGKFFTVDVTIRDQHRLKTDGIFKMIRHPNYLGLLLSFFAIGLAYNNWIALLVVIFPITISFIIRINIEEQVLIQHFGEEYTSYCKKTKRLIPFIY